MIVPLNGLGSMAQEVLLQYQDYWGRSDIVCMCMPEFGVSEFIVSALVWFCNWLLTG